MKTIRDMILLELLKEESNLEVLSFKGLHKEIPISKSQINEIIRDIRKLYPEAVGVSVVGTYARSREAINKTKSHDVDVLIKFPENIDEHEINARRDESLWNKWRRDKIGVTIDFLKRFGEKEPFYGQHRWRLKKGLPVPEIEIWKSMPTRTDN